MRWCSSSSLNMSQHCHSSVVFEPVCDELRNPKKNESTIVAHWELCNSNSILIPIFVLTLIIKKKTMFFSVHKLTSFTCLEVMLFPRTSCAPSATITMHIRRPLFLTCWQFSRLTIHHSKKSFLMEQITYFVSCWPAGWMSERVTEWLTDWLTDWLTSDWLTYLLAG